VTEPGDDEFPDWQPAPNIRDNPELYELENIALDPDGLVLAAMREAAPWVGRRLVDLGCGNGFWLPGYAAEASDVVGVEPDSSLLRSALARVSGLPNVRVGAGSAEHLPLDDAAADVVHARFAYFFGPGAEPGLAEVLRVLTAGGTFIAIDNDHCDGEFADILRAAGHGFATRDQADIDRWWADNGARAITVRSEWRFGSHRDLTAVLRNEFRDGAADAWLSEHPDRLHISYGFRLYVVTKPPAT
jgi:SAM-dependent methyltransferase